MAMSLSIMECRQHAFQQFYCDLGLHSISAQLAEGALDLAAQGYVWTVWGKE